MSRKLPEIRNEELTLSFPSSSSSASSSRASGPLISTSKKLFEISGDLLKDIEKGCPLVLKGTEKDEAVLCTANKTFFLKKVETSNTVYLIPPVPSSSSSSSSTPQFLITGQSREYFEVRPRPKNPLETAHRLRETLLSCEGHRSLPSLLAAFPLSEGEIHELLPAIGAFASSSSSSLMSEEQLEVFPREALFDGYLQLLSGIVASGLSLAKIPRNFCEETLKIRPHLSTLLARNLQNSSSPSHDGEERIEFNAERVIRLGALLTILRYPHRVLEKEKFLTEWSATTPEVDPASPNVAILKGLLQEKKTGKNQISYEIVPDFAVTLSPSEYFFLSLL